VTTSTPLRLFGAPPFAIEPDPVELESVDCPLCGGREHKPVLVAEDTLTHRGGMFRIVRCSGCELTFTNPRPTTRALGEFYPADYSPHLEREPGERRGGSWRRRLELAFLRQHYGYPPQPTDTLTALTSTLSRVVIRRPRTRERWIPFRAPGRLLDFGCGAGDFIKKMRGCGWKVEGLDLSPRMVNALRQKGEFRAHLGTLPHPDISAGSFDAITMWHSLEHVTYPQQVLRAAAEALRPRGVLGLTVPNFDSWSLRQFQRDWFGLALPRHFTHFTPETLSRMVEAAGFRILLVEQVGRDGWIRKSARTKCAAGAGSPWLSLLRSKPIAALAARWTELTGQADSFRMIAERI
jgi:2-polyprenyl-3-methyl-5-hydroxy-6-metoxy-1,4-benzoquinol methylase